MKRLGRGLRYSSETATPIGMPTPLGDRYWRVKRLCDCGRVFDVTIVGDRDYAVDRVTRRATHREHLNAAEADKRNGRT